MLPDRGKYRLIVNYNLTWEIVVYNFIDAWYVDDVDQDVNTDTLV